MAEATLDEIAEAYYTFRSRRRRENTLLIDCKGVAALREMMDDGDQPLERVSSLNMVYVDSYVVRRSKSVGPCAINQALEAAARMLKWAVKREMCARNPLKEIERLDYPGPERRRAFKIEEIRELLSHMSDHYKLIFQVYLCTGMRRTELLELPWSEVDLEHAVITLSRDRTKSRKKRAVLLGPRLTVMLDVLPRACPFVFPNPETLKPYSPDRPRRWMVDAAKAAGWEDMAGLSPQSLRRSFATIAYKKAGKDEVLVGKLLGHKGKSLAADSYIEIDMDDMRAAVVIVEDLVLGKAG